MPLPPSQNYLTDNDDLLWHLHNTARWEEIYELLEPNADDPEAPSDLEEAKETYLTMLEEIGRFVACEVAPRIETIDAEGTKLVDGEVVVAKGSQEIFEMIDDMGLFGISMPREVGGMNCPMIVYFTLGELIARADCGTMTHFSFYGGVGMALLAYGVREGTLELEDGKLKSVRFQKQIEEMASGEHWGAMDLTEPDAGSDLSAIRTRAVQNEQGEWRLNGEKIFITSGHGQHHLVLAKTSDPTGDQTGLECLSLFLVPRVIERDGKTIHNIKVTKVEKKLGHNSSATVSLLYEDSEGELIGELGQGFKLMLVLMNNARVAVGFEGLGVCESAFRMATKYASERVTMGKPIKDHELIADMLQEMDTQIRGVRALAFEAMGATEVAHKLEVKIKTAPPADADELKRLERRWKRELRRARSLTPLLKYVSSEKAVEFARTNMQIHGGMGYISETGADRLLRDALVLPVYEGTSQIQALMALKDALGDVMKNPTKFLADAARARLDAQVARGPERVLRQAELKLIQSMESILGRIVGTKLQSEWTEKLAQGSFFEKIDYLRNGFMRSWDRSHDFAHGLLHAERLTQILIDVEISRILLRQGQEHPERMVYAKRYLLRMLPRVTMWAMQIQSSDLEDLMGQVDSPELAAATN
jgi:3-(methylthio)propanoyl-CoA dehydrogenase